MCGFLLQSGSCASAEVTIPLIMLAAGWMEAKSGGSVNTGGSVPESICSAFAAAWLREIFGGAGAPLVAVSMVEDLHQISMLSGEDVWTVPRKVMGLKFLWR